MKKKISIKKKFIIAYFFCILFIVLVGTQSCSRNNKVDYTNVPVNYHSLLDSVFNLAGKHSIELQKALTNVPDIQKEGMAFLLAYMPLVDIKSIPSQILTENCKYAYIAKNEYSWAKNLPDSIFFNYVLPYYNLNEYRDNWREDFYNRFSKYVSKCKDINEAVIAINDNIINEVKVEYNTKRDKADQSPYESMKINMASCTGLSIILSDALRAVGIPCRVVGCPLWFDDSGNHNWVEVWIDGNWYYTEYATKDKLDSGWVLEKAGRGIPNDSMRAIFAASYKPATTSFTLVWDTLNTLDWVHANDVTQRYISLLEKSNTNKVLDNNEILVKVWLLQDEQLGLTSGNRIATNVEIFNNNKSVASGITSNSRQDMNDCLSFVLNKKTIYIAKYKNKEGKLTTMKIFPKDTLILN